MIRALSLTALLLALPIAANAQDRAGRFDFYVLSLSWSPTFCLLEATAADNLQCGAGRRRGFILHGLWPQYERGYPDYCPNATRDAPAATVRGMLDLMPDSGLVRHQWRKHGTCSGLTPRSYFELSRRAVDRVRVPSALQRPGSDLATDPARVEAAFLAANPGLPGEGLAITCTRGRLDEVRVCLTKTLDFRRCPEVDARACRASRLSVPAPR